MIEGAGFWIRYLIVLTILITIARALWLARKDEREARLWSERRECLKALEKLK